MKKLFTLALLSLVSLIQIVMPKDDNLVLEFSKGDAASEKEAFKALISGAQPVVVKFTMVHCEPCKETEAAFRALALEYKDRATFMKVDIYQYDAISDAYNIQYAPAWGIFVRGKAIGKIISGRNKLKEMQTNLDAYLASHRTLA